ncbi:MAG: HAMP domain-containing histidine kinase [Gammaproteobacteria bacterium]|nr:HAMP domain-containing histidine kinase [Gammaproteobacteria bacterium]
MIRNILHRVAHSLSARLLGIFFITALVYAFSARFVVELVLDRDTLRETVGSHVALHTTYFLEDLGLPPSIERAREITQTNPMDIRIIGPDMDWASDPNFPDLAHLEFEPSEYLKHVKKGMFSMPDGTDVLGKVGFARHDDHSFVHIEMQDYEIFLSSPKVSVQPSPNLTVPLIGLISIVVLFSCFFAVSWLIRPIQWIKVGADRIRKGDLDYRIPTHRHDDLGNLTVDINRLAEDVREMLEAKQQMLLAISHELRSPLTRTKVALEFLDDEQTKASILDDVLEMESLITDLLESERLNTRHSKLQKSELDFCELVTSLVEHEFARFSHRLKLDKPDGPVIADLDGTRIRLLLKNLIDNALRYSPEDKDPILVRIEQHPDKIWLSVIDHGPGMSAEEVERATEPFYRADPARCRNTGGFGLGLYLCRRITEAHGGLLKIESELNQGTRVCLELPLGKPVS